MLFMLRIDHNVRNSPCPVLVPRALSANSHSPLRECHRYEAKASMAIKLLTQIAAEAAEKYGTVAAHL